MKENPLEKISTKALIERVIYSFIGLDERYRSADMEKKRQIVCSLFPGKLFFDGVAYRTPQPNLIKEFISLINK